MDAKQLHELITLAFESRDRAYAPYSKFRVGAALLTDIGPVGGCNVENASYGAGICAERTAAVAAVAKGMTRIHATVVVSDIPEPTVSPCGICRQFLREFSPLDMPVYIVASTYPTSGGEANILHGGEYPLLRDGVGVRMTLGELLPMSFGPDHLLMERDAGKKS